MIPYICEDVIDKYVPRYHRLSSDGKPCDAKRCSLEWIFYSNLTLMIGINKLRIGTRRKQMLNEIKNWPIAVFLQQKYTMFKNIFIA